MLLSLHGKAIGGVAVRGYEGAGVQGIQQGVGTSGGYVGKGADVL